MMKRLYSFLARKMGEWSRTLELHNEFVRELGRLGVARGEAPWLAFELNALARRAAKSVFELRGLTIWALTSGAWDGQNARVFLGCLEVALVGAASTNIMAHRMLQVELHCAGHSSKMRLH